MKRRQKVQLLSSLHPAQLWGAGLLVLCVCLALVMLIMEKVRPDIMSSIRGTTADIVAPIAGLFSTPQKIVSGGYENTMGFFDTYEDNKRLKKENAELIKWQTAAHAYARENEQLRALLRVVPESKSHYISARMVGAFDHGPRHISLISAGLEDGIKKHRAVIGAGGLLGRVIEVGKQNARVLLITDINANIPVISERSGFKAILTGYRGGESLKLDLVDKPEAMQVGDRLVTSGDGGTIPPGIPVAGITSVSGANIFAAPLADINHSSMVTVVDYSF